MKKLDLVARAVTMCRGAVSDGDARMLLWTVPTRYPIKESPGEVELEGLRVPSMASLSRPCLLYRGFFEDASRRLKKAPAGSKISLLSSACGSSPILGCSTRVSRSLVSAELGARLGAVRAAVEEAKIVQQEEEEEEKGRPLRVGIICGGPSAERGISLNSARSVLDHIQGEDLHVSCYYIDCSLNAYAISPAQLYSNTPADFDFKLESLAQGFRSLHTFVEHLAVSVDIVFPVIHGRFGEDGGIQELLEKANVPFVGTASHECRQAFDKYNASLELSRQGFLTVPSFLVQGNQPDRSEMIRWFEINHLHKETGKVVVKPTLAGSSIGVTVAYGVDDAIEKAINIIREGIDDNVLVEVFLEGGSEFTAIIIDVGIDNDAKPVVLLPTEVAYHTPPRFPTDVIECIRQGASLLFQHFGLRDFARIDGWFLPGNANMFSTVAKDTKFGITESGNIIFTDINLISGMEQTSFLFQQASKVGFSHSNVLRTIIQHACLRYPSLKSCSNAWNTLSGRLQSAKHSNVPSKIRGSQKAFVLFGGETSERQVSLMSGTNVWLNLQGYDDLDVIPCLLAPANGYGSAELKNADQKEICRTVWTLPYSLVLRHTTEEVLAACIEAVEPDRALLTSHLRDNVMRELSAALSKHYWFSGFDINEELPANFTLENWIKHAKESQSILTSLGVFTIPKVVRRKEELLNSYVPDTWQALTSKLQSKSLCVKPARDGCSTGVARLCSMEDLEVYVNALRNSLPRIPANSLLKAHGVIEMPSPPPQSLIFEPFIETDEIIVSSKSLDSNARHLTWEGHTGWVEVTVGVMGTRGEMHSLSPSITVKETGDILSLEEKFQGGTGINLTPPPAAIISDEALQRCKQRIEIIANTLGLEGFSRIDAFMNVQSGEVLVIEVNTIPGMTPSTALIHQALAEQPPIRPQEFFRTVLEFAQQRSN
ncbi:D-ala D-ala ligase N-terminus [Musa troglodytarum]|uniref:D-ala D-ala ligase N-terminus n=2 Tax=Musa troglodytarum TaxID=320322 RepID=A0A9E7L850_9LILI|nr:D-ala D-ala ligase N-terminus [Musa troglodytarum]